MEIILMGSTEFKRITQNMLIFSCADSVSFQSVFFLPILPYSPTPTSKPKLKPTPAAPACHWVIYRQVGHLVRPSVVCEN